MAKSLLLVLTIFSLNTSAQDYSAFSVKLVNETGLPIEVVLTHYGRDTLASINRLKFTDEKWKPSQSYFGGIRLDIVALNGSDTVFSKSIKHATGQKTVRIVSNQFSMDEPIEVTPRLRIIGSNKTGRVFAVGDHAVLKLHSKKKIRGFVSGYTKSSITMRTRKGKTVNVAKDDLKAIREMDAVFTAGARFVLFPYFKFTEIKDIKFEFVRWDDSDDTIGRDRWQLVE